MGGLLCDVISIIAPQIGLELPRSTAGYCYPDTYRWGAKHETQEPRICRIGPHQEVAVKVGKFLWR